MKYYLIAGERSGDLHGGNLIKALQRHDTRASFRGFGGDRMKEAGMDLVVHYDQLAFMGFVKVLLNFRTLSRYFKKCQEDILAYQPDVLVLIDYGGFNMRMAKFAKEKGVRVFFYISPKVWAWNVKRALKLKATVDRMFCILPFEKEFFAKFDWSVDYVGNPVLDAVKAFQPDPTFLLQEQLSTDKPLIALLPGSRRSELERIVPVMAEVIGRFPQYSFVVAAVHTLPRELYAPLEKKSNVKFVYERTYDLLNHARAAIVTSGTATLETGLFKIPQVCVFIAHPLEYAFGKRVLKVPYISLVNLILNRGAITELLQHAANPSQISEELVKLAEEGPYRNTMLTGYDELYQKLDTGSASENAGRLMVQYLSEKAG